MLGAVRLLWRVLYWLAVLAVSIVVLVALVLFLESRDRSEVDPDAGSAERAALTLYSTRAGDSSTSRAKTTMRWAAL